MLSSIDEKVLEEERLEKRELDLEPSNNERIEKITGTG
jgi:hypothetical protein